MTYPHHSLIYYQVDVFSRTPFMGNGLAVFPDAVGLDAVSMARITDELRQFESIFLTPRGESDALNARIFTMQEELAFAGHPILGAATVLHVTRQPGAAMATWQIYLGTRAVTVQTEQHPQWFTATMDQGRATFGEVATAAYRTALLPALNLSLDDLADDLPPQMVTTGLPYLIVPVHRGLERARIVHPQFEQLLGELGAKFVYVVDVAHREGRTWDNAGLVEDSATGSAAGPVGAYLVRHGRARAGDAITIHQGQYVGRPSELHVRVRAEGEDDLRVMVSGDVVPVGVGTLRVPITPSAEAMGHAVPLTS